MAIELAEARIRTLSPEALLARLDRRLSLLTGGARDAPGRQRTMRDAIAWSYDLLTPDEQALFRRLAIFVGGCTLEAVDAVLMGVGGDPKAMLDGIASVVDKSLLRRETDPDGEPRYRMLETVRESGLERLAANRENADIHDSHRGVGLGGVAAALTAAGWQVDATAQDSSPIAATTAEPNAIVVLFGHPTDVAAFEDYYLTTHRPLALQMPNLLEILGGPVLGNLDGSEADFHRMAILRYASQDDLEASLASPEGEEAFADVANFATGGVTALLTSLESTPGTGATATPIRSRSVHPSYVRPVACVGGGSLVVLRVQRLDKGWLPPWERNAP